jgi:hypothetical protein
MNSGNAPLTGFLFLMGVTGQENQQNKKRKKSRFCERFQMDFSI